MKLDARVPTPKKGAILSFWLPSNEFWMRRVILRLRKMAEERGVRISEGMIIKLAMEEYLRLRAIEEDFDSSEELEDTEEPVDEPRESPLDKITKPDLGKMVRKRMVVFKVSDEPLLALIDRIVATKKAANIKTSFSYELTRLATNGYANEMRGSDMDKAIIADRAKSGVK